METHDRPLELSVVVPVFNERGNIGPLVAEIARALHGQCRYEVVYVDDGSDDGTAAELESIKNSSYAPLRVVTLSARQGQSAAIVHGIAAAGGDWIATIDGDGQNLPEDIPRLLRTVARAHDADPDVVCIAGIRVKREDSRIRKLSSRVANAVRTAILQDGVPDTGCGLKVFRREAFLSVPHFKHLHRFIPAVFQFHGGKVITSPVAHRPRSRGVSKYGISDRLFAGLVDLIGVSWLRRRAIDRPWLVQNPG